MKPLNRRHFLETSAALAAAAGAARATLVQANEQGDLEREQPVDKDLLPPSRVAVMGLNGRGKQLIPTFLNFPSVQISYLCDPDANTIPPAVKLITDANRPEPKAVKDFRTALDDPEVDVLVCAAPDHWHALATILACQAGKDVYVEKPVSHNLVEGRRMVEAARHYKRIVQAGMQRRSGSEFIEAVKRIGEGQIGQVHLARTWITSIRPSIGHESVTQPPENLDFDLWAGPGAADGYKSNLVHYHWHWRWDYGTGECGNNGIHAIDIARWGMGVGLPRYVSSGGNKYFFDDDQETPDTQVACFDYEHGSITWEHRTWSDRGIDGNTFGIVFYGSEGTLALVDNGFTIFKGKKTVDQFQGAPRSEMMDNHVRNFLTCCHTRGIPNADIEIAHLSTGLCHLANIAWRTRSTLEFDAASETIVGNPAAARLLSRTYRAGYELPRIG